MKICPKCGFPMDVCYTNGELEYYKCPRCVWVLKGDEEFVDYKVFAEWVAAKIFEDGINDAAFCELACRKLAELGVINQTETHFIYPKRIAKRVIDGTAGYAPMPKGAGR